MTPSQIPSRPRSTAQDPSLVVDDHARHRSSLQRLSSSIRTTRSEISSFPTPAPSPQPVMASQGKSSHRKSSDSTTNSDSGYASTDQDSISAALAWSSLASTHLPNLSNSAIDTLITSALPHLTSTQLLHLAAMLPARLKRDFLADLPPEIALHILSFVDDVKTLARASRVSRTWRILVNDEAPWKVMCARRGFEVEGGERQLSLPRRTRSRKKRHADTSDPYPGPFATVMNLWATSSRDDPLSNQQNDRVSNKGKQRAQSSEQPYEIPMPLPFSYRKHFKTAHITESNWRHSGRLLRSHRSQDVGVVTSLAMDDNYIVVGLSSSRVHVFAAATGVLMRTLIGHDAGVWSLWLVSKGGGRKSTAKGEHKLTPMDTDLYPAPNEDDSWSSIIPHSLRAGIGLATSSSAASSLSASSSSESSSDLPFQSLFDNLKPPSGDSEEGPYNEDPSASQSDPCSSSRGWGQAGALVLSAGCDKHIRVWDVKSGYCLYILRGHRSTVRCIKVFHGRPIAVSGGRDHTLRVWDIQKGTLLRTLEGHTDSVRCLDVYGNKVVSGSYDCTVRLWDVDTGECLRVFNGHYHQVYTVAFDGERIASGGLDTTVRIWSASTGTCLALLQGHTALVCQLQLSSRTNTVLTGSADGRIIIFSIAPAYSHLRSRQSAVVAASTQSDALVSPPSSPALGGGGDEGYGSDISGYCIVTRVPAHSSSMTGLQFDDRPGRRWVVSGGNDGRVQLWEFDGGGELKLIRDLTEPCEGLWKVAFRGDLAMICCLRAGRTILEMWSFRPVEEDL